MEICRDCPNKYPWVGDSEGTGIPGRDNYIFSGEGGDDKEEEEEESRK